MWLIVLDRRDVQSFLHLHQLLAQLLRRRRSRCAYVRAYVHVVGWVENCTRQVFYMPVQTSTYTGTSVVNTTVFTCYHTHHGVYICTRAGAFYLLGCDRGTYSISRGQIAHLSLGNPAFKICII